MQTFLNQLPQQLVNGLTLGAVYALIALGYSMVYGVLQLLNFAHGDVYMIGAYFGFFAVSCLNTGHDSRLHLFSLAFRKPEFLTEIAEILTIKKQAAIKPSEKLARRRGSLTMRLMRPSKEPFLPL